MNRVPQKIISLVLIILFATSFSAYPQLPPSQTPSAIEKTEEDIKRDKELKERIKRPKPEEEEGIVEEERVPLEEGKKVLIKKIEVRNATLLPASIINSIIAQYEGKELSVSEMQKVCDLITDEYRKKGYVTSRAYLPPQTIKEGLLIIMVIEGTLGSLETKGNRYFTSWLLEKKIRLRPGDTFDYKSLQKSLRYINEHPDRHVKAVLVPGKEPGTTDIVLEVEDRLPIHVGMELDNFGSRYVHKWRLATTAEDNNLLGFDDRLYLKYQRAQDSRLQLINARYIFPVGPTGTDIGAYYIWNKVKLMKELSDLGVRGKAELAGIFLAQRLIDEYNIDLTLNLGFDYKRIRNFLGFLENSKDYTRVVKTGIDADISDKLGRNIFVFESHLGIPKFMDGSRKEDTTASRTGARSDFLKFIANFYRFQPMPFAASTILWKNQFQFCNRTLFANEQFQLGGVTNVRAYSPAEYSGDAGYASSIEWTFPFLTYTFLKPIGDMKIPSSKSTLGEATRFVTFYDLGYVHNNKKLAGEEKSKFLNGWGFGLRFNLPEDFSIRLEFATPLGHGPSDDIDFRTYFGLSAKL